MHALSCDTSCSREETIGQCVQLLGLELLNASKMVQMNSSGCAGPGPLDSTEIQECPFGFHGTRSRELPHLLDASVSKFRDHVAAQKFDDGHDGCLQSRMLEFQHQLGTWANANVLNGGQNAPCRCCGCFQQNGLLVLCLW